MGNYTSVDQFLDVSSAIFYAMPPKPRLRTTGKGKPHSMKGPLIAALVLRNISRKAKNPTTARTLLTFSPERLCN